LNTENDGIFLGGDEGTILIYVSAEETQLIIAKEYVYDLEIMSPSEEVYRIMEGKFIVTPEVTR
jgi:mannose-6-phosphate isomerase-like protein (cupin superfamily)